MANQIKFNIGFNVDKSGLNDLKASLAQMQNLTVQDIIGTGSVSKAKKNLKEIQDSATLVEKALAASFNPTFNTYNIDKFKAELRNAGTSISDLTSKWSQAGSAGQIAINGMARAFTKIQIPVKQTNELLDKMGKTFANTIRWSRLGVLQKNQILR